MIQTLPNFSDKLESYLRSVEAETTRPVQIEKVLHVGLSGMNFAFIPDAAVIRIQIVLPYNGTIEDFEHSIAHEATHGLLVYGRGYCLVEPARRLTSVEAFLMSTIGTMIDDVVVNRIISQAGFAPLASVYIGMARKETRAALQCDKGLYKHTCPDKETVERFMEYRYVFAWSAVRYLPLDLADKNVLVKFQKTFTRSYKDIATKAQRIRSLFEKYDVFTPSGHAALTEKVLTIWGLKKALNIKYDKRKE